MNRLFHNYPTYLLPTARKVIFSEASVGGVGYLERETTAAVGTHATGMFCFLNSNTCTFQPWNPSNSTIYLCPLFHLLLPGNFCWLLPFNFSILSTILPMLSSEATASTGISVEGKMHTKHFNIGIIRPKLNKVDTVINFTFTCRVWKTAHSDLHFGSDIHEKMRTAMLDALAILLEIDRTCKGQKFLSEFCFECML